MRGPSPEREAYWRGIMARQAESGLNAAQFCRREKIAAPSFYVWKRKLREQDGGDEVEGVHLRSAETASGGFVPVRIEGHQVDPWKAAIRIHWRWGIQVEIPLAAGRDTIDHVLRALSQIAPLAQERDQ